MADAPTEALIAQILAPTAAATARYCDSKLPKGLSFYAPGHQAGLRGALPLAVVAAEILRGVRHGDEGGAAPPTNETLYRSFALAEGQEPNASRCLVEKPIKKKKKKHRDSPGGGGGGKRGRRPKAT